MKIGETVTFHTSFTPSRLTQTHKHTAQMPTHSSPKACERTGPHIHTWSSSKGENNYFAKGHNCDPWLVFKTLSLNLNHPSSSSLPLVKWKCPLLRLIQRSLPQCLHRSFQLILQHCLTQTPSLNFPNRCAKNLLSPMTNQAPLCVIVLQDAVKCKTRSVAISICVQTLVLSA